MVVRSCMHDTAIRLLRSLEWHAFHPLHQRRPIRGDVLGIVPLFACKLLHELSEKRVLLIMQHDAQLMPHTRANEHSPTELRRDGRLVLLDRDRDLVRFFFPAVLGDRFDALELERVRIDAFFQALDLVD